MSNSRRVVVMGVSGTGKTTVGRALADALGLPFVEGDSLHPAANVEKMAAGIPLTDADRAPWLEPGDCPGAARRLSVVMRPFLSLLLAGGATTLGMVVQLTAAQHRAAGMARLGATPVTDVLVLVGVLALGVAAASLAVHWTGVLIVGAIHFLLGGLAALIPAPGFLSGAYSPTWEIAGMLRDLNLELGVGSTVFFFSGSAVVLGAFLIGAAVGVRTRWDSPRTNRSTATVASIIGGVVLLAAFGLLLTVGDDFVRHLVTVLPYQLPLAVGILVAALLAGIGGLTLRYSSVGCILAGALALVAGLVAYVARTALPFALTGGFVIEGGLLLTLGASVLGAAIAASLQRPAVPAYPAAL